MGPPLKWWTAIKAALVVCWETKRAFDHLGVHHFLMPFLKHDYREMSPLTLYVANSTQSPSHIWLLSFSGDCTARCHTCFYSERNLTSELCDTFSCHFSCLVTTNQSCNLINWAPHYRLKNWGRIQDDFLRWQRESVGLGLDCITPCKHHWITYFPMHGTSFKCAINHYT